MPASPHVEDAPSEHPLSALGVRSWVAVVAVATVLGLAESLKAVYMMRLQGVSWPLSRAFLGNLPWWYAWALLTPVIFWLANAVRLDDNRGRIRALAFHVAASIGFAALHVCVVGTLYYHTVLTPSSPITYTGPRELADMLRQWAAGFGVFEVLTYWAAAAAFYTIDLYRRHQQSSLLTARLQTRATGLQLSAVEAQVRALRMELNPHFLYNTLNSVGAFVRTEQNAAALQMLARLGDLLRGTLDRDLGAETALHRELDLLQRYLDIELVRFSDRLSIEIDVPDDIRGAAVPTLMLQPLVENAVRHGIGAQPGPGTIQIRGRRNGDVLTLTVRDTGVGLGRAPAAGAGIGLSNTRARLEQLYGGAGYLELRDAEGGGALVVVTLPFRLCREDDASHGPDPQS